MTGGPWHVEATGFAFAEGLRWHGGALWCSDVFAGEVVRVGADGVRRPVVTVPGLPSGLGFAPDGSLLISSMRDRRLLRYRSGALTVVAELGALVGGDCNDMLVDAAGRAYVGNFGYDYHSGDERRPTSLVLVDGAGRARVVADDLWFPNGMTLSPAGDRLYVAETSAERISVYSVEADGSLTDRRLLDRLDGLRPDGIVLDVVGRLWVASPGTGQLACLGVDGSVLGVEDAPGGMAQTCTTGGPDGRTLYVCCTPTHDERSALADRSGRILSRRLDGSAIDVAEIR